MYSVVVSDRQAVDACLKFADDHRFLVEPACGASLAAVCTSGLIQGSNPALADVKNVVVVVCGGNGVSLELLNGWKNNIVH